MSDLTPLEMVEQIGELAKISVNNPQAFVITAPRPLSREYTAAFRRQWKEVFAETAYANVPLVFLVDGLKLSVVDQKDIQS